jgi:hypothetical protein
MVQGMKRRMFLAAGAVSATAAVWPTGTGVLAAPAQVDVGMFAAAVARARQDLEASKLTALTEAMPGLLSLAQATMDSAAGAYRPRAAGLTSQLLTVAGHVAYRTSDEAAAASFAADARDFAEEAADPVAAAEAERVTAVVARRSGDVAATGLMMGAADRLEHATGLTEPAAVAVWAETICSTAYTAAGFGSLDDADGLLREARTRLGTVESPTRFTTNDVGVFAMSAAMNASAFDLVLARAYRVDLGLLASGHQRAHFHKDVAVAAAACDENARAVAAFEQIEAASPDFLMFRPWAWDLARNLAGTASGASSTVVQRFAT